MIIRAFLLLTLTALRICAALDPELYGPGPYYYVSTTGNDNNPGTLDQPFGTLQRAIDHTANLRGRTILLKAGTYVLSQQVTVAGGVADGNAVSGRLYITSAPANSAILDGSNVWQYAALYLPSGASHVTVRNLRIRKSNKMGIMAVGGNSLIIDGCTVEECESGIGIYRVTGSTISRCTVSHTQWNGIDCAAGSNKCLITGNTVFRTNSANSNPATRSNWGNAVQARESDSITIRNNRIFENWGEGLSLFLTKGSVAIFNIVYDNFSVNLYLDNAVFCRAEGNLIYSTGNALFYRNSSAANGINFANEIYPGKSGPRTYLNGNVVVNNIIAAAGHGFYYGTYGGIHAGGESDPRGMKNSIVAFNTVHACNRHFFFEWDSASSGNTVSNNILSSPTIKDAPYADSRQFTITGNCYHGGNPFPGDNKHTVDPQFVNPSLREASGFALKPSSPLIGKGSRIDGVDQDFFGTIRSVDPTIGAVEYRAPTGDRFGPGLESAPTSGRILTNARFDARGRLVKAVRDRRGRTTGNGEYTAVTAIQAPSGPSFRP